MDKDILQKAKDIENDIKEHKSAIETLQYVLDNTMQRKCLFVESQNYGYEWMYFEDWEIRLMIHQKKQRIVVLEKELEKL